MTMTMIHSTGRLPGVDEDGPASLAWRGLIAELDSWRISGQKATLWWRDDDVVAPSDSLTRLQGLSQRTGTPVALSVIPAKADPALAAFLSDWALATVLQHGLGHVDHEGAKDEEGRKAELASGRPLQEMLDDMIRGRGMLEALLGGRALPVLVPPWNHIPPALAQALPGAGYCGLSTYRENRSAIAGLVLADAHVNVISARGGGFIGERRALEEFENHLRSRRLGSGDAGRPTGLLTHHALMDAETWDFVGRFVAATTMHPAVRWLAAGEIFAPG